MLKISTTTKLHTHVSKAKQNERNVRIAERNEIKIAFHSHRARRGGARPKQFSVAYFAALRYFWTCSCSRFVLQNIATPLHTPAHACTVRGRSTNFAMANRTKKKKKKKLNICRSVNINLSIGNATMRCSTCRFIGHKMMRFYLGLEPCNRWATQLTSH